VYLHASGGSWSTVGAMKRTVLAYVTDNNEKLTDEGGGAAATITNEHESPILCAWSRAIRPL